MTDAQKTRFRDALSRLSDDEETLQMLAAIAVEDAPGLLLSMSEHVENGNLDGYAKSAHAMKGLLSTFETGEPVSEFQPVIEAARDGDAAATKTLHLQIQPAIKALIVEIGAVAK